MALNATITSVNQDSTLLSIRVDYIDDATGIVNEQVIVMDNSVPLTQDQIAERVVQVGQSIQTGKDFSATLIGATIPIPEVGQIDIQDTPMLTLNSKEVI